MKSKVKEPTTKSKVTNVLRKLQRKFPNVTFRKKFLKPQDGNMPQIIEERTQVTPLLKEKLSGTPKDRYDWEYSTAAELSEKLGVKTTFNGTHYQFYSPILHVEILKLIIHEVTCSTCTFFTESRGDCFGVSYHAHQNYRLIRTIDVGCGNGALLKELGILGFHSENLTGIDISPKAIERVRESGFYGYCGHLQDKSFSGIELMFLSYFIDRDSDQIGTLQAAAKKLLTGGVLALEGLFPCVLADSNGVSYGTANVTKGNNAAEDISLVITTCQELGLQLQKIVCGNRFVYSLDGFEELPSYILVFKKQ